MNTERMPWCRTITNPKTGEVQTFIRWWFHPGRRLVSTRPNPPPGEGWRERWSIHPRKAAAGLRRTFRSMKERDRKKEKDRKEDAAAVTDQPEVNIVLSELLGKWLS